MRIALFIFLFAAMSDAVFGQIPDSLAKRSDSLNDARNLNLRLPTINGKIDSVQFKANSLLNPNLNVYQSLSQWSQRRQLAKDSLTAVKELNAIRDVYQQKIDSLAALNLATDGYKHKLDSIGQISPQEYLNRLATRAGGQANVNLPIDGLQGKINEPINAIESQVNEKLNLMNAEGRAAANLPGSANLKDFNLKGQELNTDLELKSLEVNVPGVADINMPDIKNPVTGELEQLKS